MPAADCGFRVELARTVLSAELKPPKRTLPSDDFPAAVTVAALFESREAVGGARRAGVIARARRRQSAIARAIVVSHGPLTLTDPTVRA